MKTDVTNATGRTVDKPQSNLHVAVTPNKAFAYQSPGNSPVLSGRGRFFRGPNEIPFTDGLHMSSALLNDHFVEVYYTSAVDVLCNAFNGLFFLLFWHKKSRKRFEVNLSYYGYFTLSLSSFLD